MLSKKDNSGFTLIEVMIVIVIIAIMAAIGAPTISSLMPDMHLKDEARVLYTNMQQARIQAVKNNRNTAISFDTVNSNYIICDDWDETAVPPACAGATRAVQFIVALTNKDYKSGVGYGHGSATLQVDNVTALPLATDDDVSYNYSVADPNVVVFTPQGMGNPGYVYLDHKDNTTTYVVGNSSSGMIKLLKWVGGSWQ
ncbi:MAG: GspH/FimT family protein [Proteobacteria bacterium]|nr:GspH/FimT family protein [Pseudomonadota bacterium]